MINFEKWLKEFKEDFKCDREIGFWYAMQRNITPVGFVYDFYRECKSGIRNLIRWFPVIWNDRQFDYWYMFVVFRKKLIEMERFYSGPNTIAEGSDEVAKEIRKSIKYFDRLLDQDYHSDLAHRAHDEKWGELTCWTTPIENSTNYRWQSKRARVLTEAEKEQETIEFLSCMAYEDMLRTVDAEKAFKVISENWKKWWD